MKSLALIAAALVLSAGAANAAATRIAYGDLNLSTVEGAAALDARIEKAARAYCRNYTVAGSRIVRADVCERAVREEVMAQLSATARADYAQARRADRF